jgi:hypothetical protein
MSIRHNSAIAQSHLFQNLTTHSNEGFHRGNRENIAQFPDLGISKKLLAHAAKHCDTKTELQVFLCILCNANPETGRSIASRRFIANWTGIFHTNVGRGIEGLEKKNLIKCIDKSAAGAAFDIQGYQVESYQNDTTKAVPTINLIGGNLIAPHYQSDSAPPPAESLQVVENTKRCNQIDSGGAITAIPMSRVSDLIIKYIQSLSRSSKLYPEKNALEKLLEFAKPDELDRCFLYLEKNGAVGDGKKCLMPLSYLLKSFERVLELASERAVEQSRVLELKTLAEGQVEREREKQKLEEDRYAKAQAAFALAYTNKDAQKITLSPIIQSKFKFSSGNSKLVRRLAVLKWFDTSGKAKA